MRVLFVMNTFPPGYTGGAEVSNLHTCQALLQRGIDCSIIVLYNRLPEARDEWYEYAGIPVHRVHFFTSLRSPISDMWDLRVHRYLVAELRRLQPDLVHVHNISGATLAVHTACRALGIPVVNTLHDLWLLCPNNMLYQADGSFCDPKIFPRGCHRCFRRYDFWANVPHRRSIFAALTSNVKLFLSPSQALIDRHVEAGYTRERFRLLRLGFHEKPAAPPQHPEIRRWLEETRAYPLLSFAGGGVEIKGAKVVLSALPMLLSHFQDLHLAVAGGGEQRFLDGFRQFGSAVHVLGVLPPEEMRWLFAASDLVLLPSVSHENSPVVIFESSQMGTPVVGSALGGIPELIASDETGYLFAPGDSAALVQCILHHVQKLPYARRRMRLNCVRKIRTELSLNHHIEQLTSIYSEVLNS